MADTVELPVQRRPRHTEPTTVKRPKENLVAYLFLAPWFAGLLLLTAGPILASLYLSFTDFDLLTAPRWTGVDNYRRFASDPHFHNALRVTFVYVFVSVPLVVASALVVAVLLSGRRRGSGAYRSAYYLPSLLGGSVAVSVMWRQIFGDDGLVNRVLGLAGITGPSWISTPDYAVYTLVILHVWQFGSPMLIFLAGLKQIPRELHEAAAVDGAGPLRRFVTVAVPTPPCSIPCTCTRRASPISGWATPRRWRGRCSSSSRCSPRACSPPPGTGCTTPTGRARCDSPAARPPAADRRGAGHAVPAAVDGLRIGQVDRRDLRRVGVVAGSVQVRQLPCRLGRARRRLRHVLRQLVRHLGRRGRRQRPVMLDGRVRVRPAALRVQAAVVRGDAGVHHAAGPRADHPAVHAVPPARLGRHVPAADRAQVPCGRRVLHLSDGAVHPRAAHRARRRRAHRRLRSSADLPADHPAPDGAGAGHDRDLHVHLDLGRLPQPAGLPQRCRALYGAPGAAVVPGLQRGVQLGTDARDGDAVARAGAGVLRGLPAADHRGHLDDGTAGMMVVVSAGSRSRWGGPTVGPACPTGRRRPRVRMICPAVLDGWFAVPKTVDPWVRRWNRELAA